jgi:hypothetical protein
LHVEQDAGPKSHLYLAALPLLIAVAPFCPISPHTLAARAL